MMEKWNEITIKKEDCTINDRGCIHIDYIGNDYGEQYTVEKLLDYRLGERKGYEIKVRVFVQKITTLNKGEVKEMFDL